MSSADRNYEEKRSFIRMKINTPVKLVSADGEFQGVCKDLSGSGMLVLLDRELPVGTTIEASIISDENRSPFHATTEVARVDADDDGQYVIGLSITAIH